MDRKLPAPPINTLVWLCIVLVVICQCQPCHKSESSHSFFDQIWLEHKSQPFLKATVNTIFRAFDCDDFIQYNQHTNQFEFKFEAKQNMITLTKYVSLSRKKHTKEEAETLLKDRHHSFESIKPCKVQIQCVNLHEIDDKYWDFEMNLTLLPGINICILALNIENTFIIYNKNT